MEERGKKRITNSRVSNDFREQLKKELKEEILKELRPEEEVCDGSLEQEEIKQEVSEKPASKVRGRKAFWIITVLIVIVLVIDVIAVIYYSNPNFVTDIKTTTGSVVKSFGNNGGNKCNDGTVYDSCSKEKPLYCYNGELLAKAPICGCPNGYEVDFQTCKKV
jgi:hypothetical protein